MQPRRERDRRRREVLLVLCCWLLALGRLDAEAPLPPTPRHYFNDGAGLVAPDVAQRLEEKLRRFDAESSNQVLVAIFRELPSPSLEDFTVRTARSWRAGRKKLDNGVVLFVFVKDRKLRIEVGYGLEGALPDATAKRIIAETIAPAFKAGNHGQGLEAGIDAIIAATRGEYRASPRPAPAQPYAARPPTTPATGFDLARFLSIYGSCFFFLFFVPIPILLLRMYRKGLLTGTGGGGTDSGTTWSSSDSSWSSSDSGSSSDFSGGGGDFGGGGASGDW